jgi:hypothetical protein
MLYILHIFKTFTNQKFSTGQVNYIRESNNYLIVISKASKTSPGAMSSLVST